VAYVVYDPALPDVTSAQQANLLGRQFWPTVRLGVFGQAPCCGFAANETPATDPNRTMGWIIVGITVALSLGVFAATLSLRGED